MKHPELIELGCGAMVRLDQIATVWCSPKEGRLIPAKEDFYGLSTIPQRSSFGDHSQVFHLSGPEEFERVKAALRGYASPPELSWEQQKVVAYVIEHPEAATVIRDRMRIYLKGIAEPE